MTNEEWLKWWLFVLMFLGAGVLFVWWLMRDLVPNDLGLFVVVAVLAAYSFGVGEHFGEVLSTMKRRNDG